jgi:hypothetical protein
MADNAYSGNPWSNLTNMTEEYKLYAAYLQSGTDPLLKATNFNKIMTFLRTTASPTGQGGYDSYLQQLLRSKNYSTGKTAAGDFSAEDQSGLEKALIQAAANGMSLTSYLSSSAGLPGAGAPKVDTTPKYSKQISVALKLKDFGDAQNALYDAYYQTYGMAPTKDIVTKFQEGWNAQVQKQEKPTATDYVTTYEKVKDPKTGKTMYDASGLPVYKSITKQTTTANGEGFTQGEQEQFLAQYLANQYPADNFDTTEIGGVAKSIYDDITATYKNNFQQAPSVAAVAPLIKQIIGSADANTAKQVLADAKTGIRNLAATKYMGIADKINAGEDANKYIDPLIKQASEFLEVPLEINDAFITKALNYQGTDKAFRLMNDYELSQALVKDPRYGKTSKAKNEALNLAQSITSKLG